MKYFLPSAIPNEVAEALYHAASAHDVEFVREMMKCNVDPNCDWVRVNQKYDGSRAIEVMFCNFSRVKRGNHHEELLDLLLLYGAVPTSKAYYFSTNFKNIDCVKTMWNQDRKMGIVNKNVLYYCARFNIMSLVEWLLENGANIQDLNEHGHNVLYQTTDPEMIKYLVEKGADCTKANYHESVAYHPEQSQNDKTDK